MGQPRIQDPATSAPGATQRPDPFEKWTRPRGLTRRGWAILGALVLLVQLPLLHRALRGGQPVSVSLPYADDFSDPSTVERNYWSTGGHWRVVDGWLLSPGVKNNPLWLQASLPQNVAVEFDVKSTSREGDIKVELFGDGLDHASGYVFIHGGWNNSLSIIARLDEHGAPLSKLQAQGKGALGPDTRMRVEARPFPVEIGRTYHWRIERRGGHLRWLIDGQPFMEFDDPHPLAGPGHDRFGFSGWEAQLYFDNLRVQPL